MRLLILTFATFFSLSNPINIPDGFVYLKDIDNEITVDLKYYSKSNFTGKFVDGYYSKVQEMGGNRWDNSSLIALLKKKK